MTATRHIEMRGVTKAFRYFTLQDLSLDSRRHSCFVGPNAQARAHHPPVMCMLSRRREIRVLGCPMPERRPSPNANIVTLFGYAMLPNSTVGWHRTSSPQSTPLGRAYAAHLGESFNLRPDRTCWPSMASASRLIVVALARGPPAYLTTDHGLDRWRARNAHEFMDVLRDDSRSILFSSHNTVDVERISDRITFIDRGRLVACCDKEEFLERWRRIEVQLPPGESLPELPNIVARASDGHFHTLTTNYFSDEQVARLGATVRNVQRMNLEEIFVAKVMFNREARAR